jgi:hypothetical protein
MMHRIQGPREFRHALSAILNGLAQRGLLLLHFAEDDAGESNAEPGSWEHYLHVTVPFLRLWATYRPEMMGRLVDLKQARNQL